MKRWQLVCGFVLGGCASSGGTIDETRSFSDALGRTCQAKLSRTSEHAPAVSEAVSCDGAARQCSTEAHACFELSTGPKEESYPLRNCPACCSGTASSFVMSECSPVVCTTASDCVFSLATCVGGACVCPNGLCD